MKVSMTFVGSLILLSSNTHRMFLGSSMAVSRKNCWSSFLFLAETSVF